MKNKAVLEKIQAEMRGKPRKSRKKARKIEYFCNKCAKSIDKPAYLCSNCSQNHLWDGDSLLSLPGVDVVYFVQGESGGAIKIGCSTKVNLTRKLKDLQIGNPDRLRFVAVINNWDRDRLNFIHDKFKIIRLTGEWFAPSEELVAYIRSKSTRCVL